MKLAPGFLTRRIALLSLAGLASVAVAQTSADFTPQHGQSGKDVVWIPTPDTLVQRMLQMAEVKPTDRVFDLGSGDGKIAIAAARDFGARATGLEYNPDMVALSQRHAKEAGVADKVEFRQADIFQSDFSSANVITLYLLPDLNLKLRPILLTMAPGTRVVSHAFTMGDWQPDETARIGGSSAYLWRIPANASGEWKLSGSGLANATLSLSQRYQVLSGNAIFEDLEASVVHPRISGDRISFALRTPQGEVLQLDGRVADNRITGNVTRPGRSGSAPFEATRNGAPSPIAGRIGAAERHAGAETARVIR